MGTDVKNVSDGTTGNQLLGNVTIKTPGKGTNGRQIYEGRQITIEVAAVTGVVKDLYRFPRYYEGDTIN